MIDSKAKLITRTLYRSLIRASKPFTEHTTKGALLSSLLYRSGDDEILESDLPNNVDRSLHLEQNSSDGTLLYKLMVSEIIGGHDKHMNFPSQILASLQSRDNVMDRLHDMIRREFRDTVHETQGEGRRKPLSHPFSYIERRNAAFLGLRQLNQKLQFAEKLGIPKYMDNVTSFTEHAQSLGLIHSKVERYNKQPSNTKVTDRIRPGSFLIAHPLLQGYFARSVIMILEHTDTSKTLEGGTYGLIINRPSFIVDPTNKTIKRKRTLSETIRSDSLPRLVQKAFGKCPILEGGPVNFSLQMLQLDPGSTTDEKQQSIPDDGNVICLGENVEKIYYGGDIMKASRAVLSQSSNLEDYLFVVGASCWETGQLENEFKQGYWSLCEGPLLFDNVLRSLAKDEDPRDMWISYTDSLSKEDGILALLTCEDVDDENGLACDML